MRLRKLREQLETAELDAMLVTRPENYRYLSGFTGSQAMLAISARQALLATDFRYIEQATKQAPGFEIVRIENSLTSALPDLLERVGGRRVGFESGHVTVAQFQQWLDRCEGFEFVAVENAVEHLRAIKEEGELALLREAGALSDAAMAHLTEIIRPGMSEKALAWEVEVFMRTHGADGLAFEPIVASGPNGAMAHHRPSERLIRSGEPVVVDIGARVGGYCSDLTRTLWLGAPDGRFREVCDIVLRAQRAAEVGIRPGMTGKEADGLARAVIEEAGYGEAFGHGLGHGIGLSAHEMPRLGKTSETTLAAGMVVTVEPGIYLSGWGGVRIEDVVVVGPDGVEVLSQARKELIIN